jgi:hypothetical protein
METMPKQSKTLVSIDNQTQEVPFIYFATDYYNGQKANTGRMFLIARLDNPNCDIKDNISIEESQNDKFMERVAAEMVLHQFQR